MNRFVISWRIGKTLLAAALLAVALASASACMVVGGGWVTVAPPEPVVEVRAVSPGPDFIWIPGYYDYSGGGYVWVAGRWARPPHRNAEWVPDRWEHQDKGYRHVKGHWRDRGEGRDRDRR